jgi:hypothetical protein
MTRAGGLGRAAPLPDSVGTAHRRAFQFSGSLQKISKGFRPGFQNVRKAVDFLPIQFRKSLGLSKAYA